MLKEERVYEKALDNLNRALSGRHVHPNALNTAIAMWTAIGFSVHAERLRIQAEREKKQPVTWENTIDE